LVSSATKVSPLRPRDNLKGGAELEKKALGQAKKKDSKGNKNGPLEKNLKAKREGK